MFIYERNGENIPTETEAYYEAVASQEEIYLEETEEELRMILESDDLLPAPNECPNQQCEYAEEPIELINADSDDPPLIEQAVEEMFR